MAYLGTQPNDVKKNIGLYTPSEILQLTKDGSWGGSLELIEEQTFSGVSSVEFTDIKENVYDVHFIQVSNFQHNGANNSGIRWLLSNNGGTSYITSGYQMAFFDLDTGGGTTDNKSTSRAHFQATNISLDRDTNPTSRSAGYYYLYNAGNSSKYTFQTNQTYSVDTSYNIAFGGAVYTTAETINAFKFDDFGTGYNLYGTIKLYGVKQI